MRNKKVKGIRYDIEVQTIPHLLQMINEELEKKREELAAQWEAQREEKAKAEKEEKAILGDIARAEKILEKMKSDYRIIEAETIASIKAETEKNVLRESAVRKGEISLQEFNKAGKFDKDLAKEIQEKSAADLEISLGAIRDKALEILGLKDKLGSCRWKIRNIVVQPGLSMAGMLKGVTEFADEQTAIFMGELEIYRAEWNAVKELIQWTKGRNLAPAYRWNLTPEQAKSVAFDPILPMTCVKQLMVGIEKYKDSKSLDIVFNWRLKEVDVSPSPELRRGLLQTSQVKEAAGETFKRDEK